MHEGLLNAALVLLLSFGVINPALAAGQIKPASASQPATQPALSLDERAFQLTQQDEYDSLILDAARRWKLDPFLLKGLLFAESRFDARRINSRSGAAGIAQFTATGRKGIARIRRMRGCDDEFTRADALDPEKAIPAAAELLSYLTNKYGRFNGVAYYNGGKQRRSFATFVFRIAAKLRTLAGLPPALRRPPRVPLPVS